MNKKRKHPRLLAALTLLLLLCACSPSVPDGAPFSLETAGGDRLTLGMSRAEIDAMLTTEEGYSALNNEGLTLVSYHGGAKGPISVTYVPDEAGVQTAVSLTLGQFEPAVPEASAWSIQGITLGSSLEEVRAALGYPTRDYAKLRPAYVSHPEHWNCLAYDYFADGTLLAADTGDNAFSLFFLLTDGNVSCLALSQKDYGPGFDLP